MIERLNFYDIYGYLIPGMSWLVLVWLPFGLVGKNWLPAELSSALMALVLGYLVGHVLQRLAEQALPSTKKDASDRLRYPSDVLLDDQNNTFSREVKSRLEHRILIYFDIDVRNGRNPDPEVLKKRHQDAFMLCRRTLIQKGVASYAEQFEGMYVLMRGVMAACILAAAYYLGWALNGILPPSFIVILALGLILLTGKTKEVFWLLGVFLFILGDLFGSGRATSLETSFLFLGMCVASVFISIVCCIASQQFSHKFAETGYRDFCAL